jgi:hypothetical protein
MDPKTEKTEQLPPMTPEQLEAEAAFAKEIFFELSDPTPETDRKISEAIKLKRRSRKPLHQTIKIEDDQ